jgi:hypothetical protein
MFVENASSQRCTPAGCYVPSWVNFYDSERHKHDTTISQSFSLFTS